MLRAPMRVPRMSVAVSAFTVLWGAVGPLPAMAPVQGVPGEVLSERRISSVDGGFTGVIEPLDEFGTAVTNIGDLDGDGFPELMVGAWGDDDGVDLPAEDRGAVWVLFLEADGTVRTHTKISETSGGFGGDLDDFDRFGHSMSALGDLDGDGVTEVAVGAVFDDDGGSANPGAIYVLFMNADGTVKAEQKVSQTVGGLVGPLDNGDLFGHACSGLGDLDGDGVFDVAVGSDGDDDGGTVGGASNVGAFRVLFLNADGTVKGQQKVSATTGGFGGTLLDKDAFGHTLANLGDVDGDGVVDLAVGAPGDDDGIAAGGTSVGAGAVWICFMNTDGTVKSELKISQTSGVGFTGPLGDDRFSESIASLGDVDGDGVGDIAVGAFLGDDPLFGAGSDTGVVWLLLMNPGGTVKAQVPFGLGQGGFEGILFPGEHLGHSMTGLGDLDGDGRLDMATGAPGDASNTGSVWVTFHNAAVWSDLGGGLAGTYGEPVLSGAGALVAGELVTLSVTGALENAAATLVVGLSELGVPFKGGTLVPSPDVLIGLATDGAGELLIVVPWPAGLPPGLELVYQAWVVDAAAVKGLAATGGVEGVAP